MQKNIKITVGISVSFLCPLMGLSQNSHSTEPKISDGAHNILWIYVEDTNPWMSCYGDEVISTPNIDELASKGDRCDFTIDRIRTVVTGRYKYIRNFMTDKPYMQPNYRSEWGTMKILKTMYENGELNEVQSRFPGDERPAEELYPGKFMPLALCRCKAPKPADMQR